MNNNYLFVVCAMSENDCDVIFASDIRAGQESLFGVLVNNGYAIWVFFGELIHAKDFQRFCLTNGVGTKIEQW